MGPEKIDNWSPEKDGLAFLVNNDNSVIIKCFTLADGLDGIDQTGMLMDGIASSRSIVPIYFDTLYPQLSGVGAIM